MPNSAKKLCLASGCRNPTKGNFCQPCQARRNQGKSKGYDADRPSAAKRGYDHRWRNKREEYLAMNPFCVSCGEMAKHVDHVIPLRQGGDDEEYNYQSLCHSCHSVKTAKERKGR